jgi:hypothetical protein
VANTQAELAIESIVVGRDYERTWTIAPATGKSNSDVVTELTGATATVAIVDTDGSTSILASGSITTTITAATRLLKVEIADTATSGLTPGRYRWSAYITTTGGKLWPVLLGEAFVRRLP